MEKVIRACHLQQGGGQKASMAASVAAARWRRRFGAIMRIVDHAGLRQTRCREGDVLDTVAEGYRHGQTASNGAVPFRDSLE